jgi:hypothetical protein
MLLTKKLQLSQIRLGKVQIASFEILQIRVPIHVCDIVPPEVSSETELDRRIPKSS